MTTIFVNSLLYIWPISFLIYDLAATLPITAIVAFESSIMFGLFIISMELLSKTDGGAKAATARVLKNPILLAIVIGAALNLAGTALPAPILTFTDFAGRAAAPLTLFALGVILSQNAITPGPVDATFAVIKLVAFPAVVWAGMTTLSPGNNWQALFLLNSAGPSGAMAFALALVYGVRSDVIARVIIWTSALSLISLAALA
jgi:malonate transporter and related proteins